MLTVWPPGYQLMHQRCGAICSIGALIIHVSCMQLSLETLVLMGLDASRKYLLVVDLNVLYTPYARTLL